ncbi:hypothetical protein F4780DRAFT_172824 [Xylariomycetidae sp. FL0641]|nr:hypothetical protein F4780DRAFT_172824 [Xylariomycetidae sp. FL0641]
MAPQLSPTSTSTPSMATGTPSPTFEPAIPPPPGTTSNPDDPDTLAPLADLTIGVCLSLISLFFFTRCYVRLFIKRVWIFEDVLVCIAYGGTVAYCGILKATMSHNGGKHGWDITLAQFHQASYWFNVAAIEYGVIIGVTKISVLWLYRRVFSPARWGFFDVAIIGLIVIMAGFYGSISIAKIFECTPREKIWNTQLPGRCIEIKWILNISGGFNMVTDYIMLLLPAHAVRNLQIEKRKKLLVVLAFTFGLCAPIFATVGFVVRLQHSSSKDTSWNQPDILLWGAAELTSGLLCVCFPELAVLFRKKHRRRTKPKHPSPSEIRHWNEARGPSNQHSDPYFTKSLMYTGFSTKDDSQYIELQDNQGQHDVEIYAANDRTSLATPEDGVVMLRNEVKVERH